MTNRLWPTNIIVWSRDRSIRLLGLAAVMVLTFAVDGPVARPKAYATLAEAIAATVPAGGLSQQAYIKSSNSDSQDLLGYSVDIDGDTAVVGTIHEDSSATGVDGNQADNSMAAAGAAYVFVRNAGLWSQQAYLKASNTNAGDEFGASVGISGDTIVVGANREDSNARGVEGALNGGLQSNNSAVQTGAAYVFVRNGSTWSQQAYLKASNADQQDHFGVSVAISGDTIAVGSQGEDSSDGTPTNNAASNAGAAYIFVRNAGTWSEQAYIKPSTIAGALPGFVYGDVFARTLALDADTLVVGSAIEFNGGEDSAATGVNGNQSDNSALESGAAWVFARTGTTWSQQAYLKASNTGAGDHFGFAVAVSGERIVVGAYREDSGPGNPGDNSATDAGAAYVFVRSGNTWAQEAFLKPSNTTAGDRFGWAASIDGDRIVIGSPYQDGQSGAAYVFSRDSGGWTEEFYLKASKTEPIDQFGHAVAISGDTIIASARGDDSIATGIDGNQADNSSINSGAVFVFGPAVNQSPAAGAGADQVVPATSAAGASVTLSESGSSDPDGDTLTYTWSEGATVVGTGATLTTDVAIGVHTFTLTVDDGNGGQASDDVVVEVRDVLSVTAATPPISPTSYTFGQVVLADYSCASTGGLLATCSGTVANGASIDTSTIGMHPFQVTATNSLGDTTTTSWTYEVVKAPSSVTVSCPASLSYTGGTQTPCTATANGAGMAPVDVSGSLVYLNNSSVGTATVSASWAGDANHHGGTGLGHFNIVTAPVTAVLTANSKVYDGTTTAPNIGLSCALTGVAPVDAGNVWCSPSAGTFENPNVGSPRSVTATLTLSGSAAGNYTFGAAGTNIPSTVAVNAPTSTTASAVYGQAGDFTTGVANNGGVSASSLASARGVAADVDGNIYVADRDNNRVLFFPFGQTTATRVYGQAGSFTTNAVNNGGLSADSLRSPTRVSVDSHGGLYISDPANFRVLYYPAGSTTATRVYGQLGSFASAVTNNGGISADSLGSPRAIAIDADDNVYIADANNNRVLFYPAGSTTATRVYGQNGSFTTGITNNTAGVAGVISADSLNTPNGIRLDTDGNLFVVDQQNNRVLMYPAGQTTATVVYGQGGDFTANLANNGGISADSLSTPSNLAVDGGNNVYVADQGNARVLFFPSGQTTATVVYGQAGGFVSGTPNNGGTSADSLSNPNSVDLDFAGNIYVSDFGNNRVLRFTGAAPAITPAPLVITASSGTKDYGTTFAVTPIYTGFVNGETSGALASPPVCTSAGSGAAATMGTYVTTCSGAASSNYSIAYVAGSLTVTGSVPVTATLTATGKTYDGTMEASDAGLACTLAGVLAADLANVTCIASNGTFDSADAGARTVTATVTLGGSAASNYTFGAAGSVMPSASASTAATITKTTATITVTGYHVTYDGAAHTATGTAIGVLGEDLSALLELGNTTHTNAGAFVQDDWTFAGNTNYEAASGFVDNMIDKATSTTTVTCAPATTVYTGAAQELCAATVTGVGGLNLTPTPVYADNVNVGTATASYAYAGDANHAASNASAAFSITPASLTVTPDDKFKVIGSADPVFTYQVSGLLAGQTAAGVLTGTLGRDAGEAAGTYAIRQGTLASNGNYTLAVGTGTLSIGYNTCVLYDPTKAVKSGATIPIKIRLCSATGANVSNSATVVAAVALMRVSNAATGDVVDAGNSNADGNFRFDPTLGPGYIFNLKTTGLAQGTYRLEIRVTNDPQSHFLTFQVR